MKNKLFQWQEECLERWRANRYKGIVNVVTGAGKTVLALAAAEALLKKEPELKIKIVVPKAFMIYQWRNALRENLGIEREDIGVYFGAHKSPASRRFMIYVINSARFSLARHIVGDMNAGHGVFLIADECHHYDSAENSRIFDFLGHAPAGAAYYALGLSATPASKRYEEVLVPALGKEIYSFSFYNALKADIISKFTVFNISVNFDAGEEAEYAELKEKLGVALLRLKARRPELYNKSGTEFFARLEALMNSPDSETGELAAAVFYLSLRRKELVNLAKARIACVEALVGKLDKTSRIIIFGERIAAAELIFRRLRAAYPGEAGIYHSRLDKSLGEKTLRSFENRELRILVSCKTLDEGLNVTETDAGIVVSSTGSRRQRVQRLGRVLRKKRYGRAARFYYLFVDNTSEESVMLQEITDRRMRGLVNVVDVSYDEKNNLFHNRLYEEMTDTALLYLAGRHGPDKLAEFARNAKLGLLGGDWLLSEDACREKIKAAAGRAERNYYTAMLVLIRVRIGKLRR